MPIATLCHVLCFSVLSCSFRGRGRVTSLPRVLRQLPQTLPLLYATTFHARMNFASLLNLCCKTTPSYCRASANRFNPLLNSLRGQAATWKMFGHPRPCTSIYTRLGGLRLSGGSAGTAAEFPMDDPNVSALCSPLNPLGEPLPPPFPL